MDAEGEFTAFVNARRLALVRLGWALTGDPQRGEDLAQASLQRLWKHWTRAAASGDPWAYTQRIAINLAGTWRRRRWTGEIPSVPAGPDQPDGTEASAAELRVEVAGWLRRLPPRQRAVVVLRYLADLSVDQTAEILGCPVGTVKSLSSRALDRLQLPAQQWSTTVKESQDDASGDRNRD